MNVIEKHIVNFCLIKTMMFRKLKLHVSILLYYLPLFIFSFIEIMFKTFEVDSMYKLPPIPDQDKKNIIQ